MSEAKLMKTPEEIRDFIVKAVIDKWNEWEQSIQEPNYPLWRKAEQFLESLHTTLEEDDLTTPYILAKMIGIDFNTFYYDMWEKLSVKQRAEVLISILNYIALRGIEAFIKTIAPDVIARLNDRKLWEDLGWFEDNANIEIFGEPKNWFLSEATDFFRRGRFNYFLDAIHEVLWPKGEWWRVNYDKVGEDDFWYVRLLAGDVTDKKELKRIVREYLVNPLKNRR